MKSKNLNRCRHHRRNAAFTLAEVLIASGTFAVACLAGFAGLAQGFKFVEMMRENLRATEILQDNTEILRLYTWDQLTNSGFMPLTFTNYFNPASAAAGNPVVTYYGTVTVASAPVTHDYADDLRMVTFQLNWTNNDLVPEQRQITTLVSKYGLHNYLYNGAK